MRFKPKTRLRPYQAQALKRAFQCGGKYGLFLAPRTGKTKVAIDFASALYLSGSNLAVVVCQLTGHPVWEQQLEQHSAAPYTLIRLTGSSRKRVETLRALKLTDTRLTVVLVNYESSWRIEEALFRLLSRAQRPILIYDEGHKLKNRTSKQSRSAHRLVTALDPYRLLLTGTAIANTPLDVFSEYQVIDNSVFGTRWKPFADRYATFYGMYNQRIVYRNLGDLRRRARTRATVLTKEECFPNLKARVYVPKRVELSPKTRKVYDNMADFFIAETDEGEESSASIVLTQMMRLSQIASGFITVDDTGSTTTPSSERMRQIGTEKLDALADYLEELMDEGEKAVVWARFRWEIEAIERLCQKRKWKHWKYYGVSKASAKKERDTYPPAFQNHKGPAVFIAQTATGALSIDLSAATNACFYSFDYSLINWVQDHDRIEGHLTTSSCVYTYLIGKKTVDEAIWASLHAKKRVSTLLDNHSLVDLAKSDAFDIFDSPTTSDVA